MTHDRATIVTTAIVAIVRGAVRARLDGKPAGLAQKEARTAIEALLRDEFADVARTTATEIRLPDE